MNNITIKKNFMKFTSTILGTGSYVPAQVYSNKYLASFLNTDEKWIFDNLGIQERHIAAPNQCTSDLAFEAGRLAIIDANLVPEDIQLIIVATATPDRLAPSTSCIVQEKLGARNSAAFDISAVCSGFLYGMCVADQFISTGFYNKILVIGSDTFSRITDWNRRDAVFFGDGAGAVVMSAISRETRLGFKKFFIHADGTGKFNFTVPAGGSEIPATKETIDKGLHFFQMNGKEVYKTATSVLPGAINQVLIESEFAIEDVSYLVPHQPSIRILQKTAELINLPFEKVLTNMDKYANTSAASIPIVLDEANKAKKLKHSDKLVFAAIGSGWTFGAATMVWGH